MSHTSPHAYRVGAGAVGFLTAQLQNWILIVTLTLRKVGAQGNKEKARHRRLNMANVYEQGRSLGPDQMDYGVFLPFSPSVAREDKVTELGGQSRETETAAAVHGRDQRPPRQLTSEG